MQEPIGFGWQSWDDGACGKYAIQHALLLLGIPVTQKDTNKATGIPPWLTRLNGTDEEHIKRALKYFRCRGVDYNLSDSLKSKEIIDGFLENGCPVIICVDEDSHWAVIAGKTEDDEYYWIDSAEHDLMGICDWQTIIDWFNNSKYYFIGVKPESSRQLNYSIVGIFSEVYELLWEDEELCQYWGYYLEDLNEIFDCPKKNENAITAEEFFMTFSRMILDATCYFYLYANEDQMEWEMDNYRTVACAHNLTISKSKVTQAIAKLSAALTCIACLDD